MKCMSTTVTVTTPTGTVGEYPTATLGEGKSFLDRLVSHAIMEAFDGTAEQTVALRAGRIARTVTIRSKAGHVEVTDFDAFGASRTWTKGEVVASLQRRYGKAHAEFIRGAA